MHISVLLNESVKYLNLSEKSIAVDCTLGYAGHSSEILRRIPKGFLFAFDQDQNAIAASRAKLSSISSNFEIIENNFVNLKSELNKREVSKVDAILFDLGVSSPQLDNAERGFSFHEEARLDMRMDQNAKLSAYEVVNEYSEEALRDIFYKYGEEKYSGSIAKKIVKVRDMKPIETTTELVEVIKTAVPEKYKREKHPARKIFQAIRIEVNNELEVFELALKDALDLISVGGRICVITFHSLEDKICKNVFRDVSNIPSEFNKMPIVPEEFQPKFKIIKTIEPSAYEIDVNKRARSAKLRVIERVREG